jgi:site-specific DNA-cytosine methylase
MTDLTFIDLFAGVGMARMGMEQVGLSVPIAKEIGERIRKTYLKGE